MDSLLTAAIGLVTAVVIGWFGIKAQAATARPGRPGGDLVEHAEAHRQLKKIEELEE